MLNLNCTDWKFQLSQLKKVAKKEIEDKFPFAVEDKPTFQAKNKELIKIIEDRIKTTESKLQKTKKENLNICVFLYVLNKRNQCNF